MLKDRFNRVHDYLRISLTDKCNLHCTYCNPIASGMRFLPNDRLMAVDEIDFIAGKFIELGIKKIRLTGGEPLVRKDAGEIIRRLSEYPVELAVTTNGVLVHRFIEAFRQAELRSVNVSLDSLIPEKAGSVVGHDVYNRVMENIHLLLKNDFHIKINTVVLKGVNETEIPDFVEWTRNFPLHVRFIEFMPFAGNKWDSGKVFSHLEMIEQIRQRYDVTKLNDEQHDTAKKYKVPGFQGTFAIISAMSQPFCSNCNRLRLTADGKMKNCLFSTGEADILSALRRGEDIEPIIRKCVWDKKAIQGGQFPDKYGNLKSQDLKNRRMISIGG